MAADAKVPRAERPAKSTKTPAIVFVQPQLATLVDRAPDGDDWLHELKFDGFRILCRIEEGEVTLFTRSGQDWTERFAAVAEAAARLRVKNALIDGEIAILRADGTTSFQSLQNHLHGDAQGALTYFAFDLLFLDGDDLRQRPLEERKAALAKLIRLEGSRGRESDRGAKAAPGGLIRYTDHVVGNGAAFFEKASAAGLEGIVSKQRREPYKSGRAPSWVKTKALKRQEFVVGGFTEPEGARAGIGALLVGFFRDGALVHAGKVGTGFGSKMALELRRRLDGLVTVKSPFESAIRGAGRQIHWVKPQLVAEIAFGEMTSDGKLRHPSFQGLREDKAATDVVQEASPQAAKPLTPAARPSARSTKRAPAKAAKAAATAAADAEVAGVKLTHPERILDDQGRVTKRDLAAYVEGVAAHMLPHLMGRPLSLVRCPEGTAAKCFFMKHAAFATPGLRRISIQEKTSKGEYLIAETVPGLVGLAQMSVIEIHTWNSVDVTLERPDRVVFDFDPGPRARWHDVVEGAMLVKERVERIGCTPFVKTTGGKGLHVVVPLLPKAGWDDCRMFSQLVSESVAAEYPERFTTAMRKEGREDKVLIDYFRNTRGATSVAAFSTRARPGMPVSLPLEWKAIESFSPAQPHTMQSTLRLVGSGYRNPWAKYHDSRVDLRDVILREQKPPSRSAKPGKAAAKGTATGMAKGKTAKAPRSKGA